MKLTTFDFKKLEHLLVAAYIIICPIFLWASFQGGNTKDRIGQVQFYQLAGFVLFVALLLQNRYLALFSIWTVFHFGFFNFPNPAGQYVINIFTACIIYQVFYQWITKERIKLILGCLIFLCVLNLLYMVCQSIGGEFIYRRHGETIYQPDIVGMLGLKAAMGMFFAMTLPFVLMYADRFKGLYLLALAFMWPIYRSDCTAAVLGTIAVVLWHVWHQSRKLFTALVLLLVIIGSAYAWHDHKQNNMMVDRANLWKVVMRDVVIHPVIGYGMNSVHAVGPTKDFMYFMNMRTHETAKCMYHKETNTFIPPDGFQQAGDPINPWGEFHNEYIQAWFEFGIVPLIILGFLLWHIWTIYTPSPINIALIGFFVAILIFGIGQFPFHLARIGYIIPVMLAMYYKINEPDRSLCHA